jgi:hypothetical protein
LRGSGRQRARGKTRRPPRNCSAASLGVGVPPWLEMYWIARVAKESAPGNSGHWSAPAAGDRGSGRSTSGSATCSSSSALAGEPLMADAVRPVCGAPGARVSFYPAVAQAPSSPGVPHSPSARPSHANSGFGVPPTQFGPPHARDARCRWYRHSAAAGGQRGKPRRRGGPGAQPDPRPKPPRRAVRRACTSSCCHNNDLLNCRSWAPRQTRDSIANRCTTKGQAKVLKVFLCAKGK